MAKKKIESPCINICKIDDKVCVGCGRTLEEIQRWRRFSTEQRQEIMKILPQRLNKDNF